MNADSKTPYFEACELERMAAPTAQGSSLPNNAYTDPKFLALENRRLFRSTWCFAGFAHDIPNVGDVYPSFVAGQPVLLVRGDDLKVRAFHNVCSHRGAQLVAEAKTGLTSLVCSNHSWTYHLDGRLRARPHFFGGQNHDIIDQQCHPADLKELACEVWVDWIFVNSSADPGRFSDYNRGVRERVNDYDLDCLEFGEVLNFHVHANWKLPIENFIEPYHVFSCHPWLNSFVSMKDRRPPEFDGHVLHCGYDFEQTDPARGEGLPYFPNLSQRNKKRGDWFVLFPNFCFEIFPDQLAVFISQPVTVDTCRETIALYFVGEGATHPKYQGARQRVIDNWRSLNHEDIGVIERMQAGRASEGFDGGVLSPYWDPVLQHFARLVAERIQPGALADVLS